MDPRERVQLAISGNFPDRVPLFESLNRIDSFVEALDIKNRYDSESSYFRERAVEPSKCAEYASRQYAEVVDGLRIDAVCTELPFEICQSAHHVDAASNFQCEPITEITSALTEFGIAHFPAILDPFSQSIRFRGGLEDLLIDYHKHPFLVHELAQTATNANLEAIDCISHTNAEGIFLLADMAGTNSTFVSPEHYRVFIKPYHRRLVDKSHKHDLAVVLHSDGNVRPFIDDFIDCGFDALHPIQPECMDIKEIIDYANGELCAIGNIDLHGIFNSTSQEIDRVVKTTIEKTSGGSGFMFGTSHSAEPDDNPEKYIQMVNAVYDHGTYDS